MKNPIRRLLVGMLREALDSKNCPESHSVPLCVGDAVFWLKEGTYDILMAVALEEIGEKVRIRTQEGKEELVDPRRLFSPLTRADIERSRKHNKR